MELRETLGKIKDYCNRRSDCTGCKLDATGKVGCSFGVPGYWLLDGIEEAIEQIVKDAE